MTTIDSQDLIQQVQVTDGVARLSQEGEGVHEFAIKELPERFVHWQLDVGTIPTPVPGTS